MFKIPFISFLAAVTLVSCISSVEMVQTPIVFNPVIGHEVRSDDMSVPFPEDESFGVWALDNNLEEFISDREIGFNGVSWTSESLPLWPINSSLTFYAYSPCSLPVKLSKGVMTLDGFDVLRDGDDLLFAQTASGLTSVLGDVKLPFRHALSRIDMRIASGYGADVQVRIDRIILKNVATVGDYDSSKLMNWTVDESTATDIVFYDSERDGQFLAGPEMQFIGELHTIIPQKLGSVIELQYAFQVDGSDWIDAQKDLTEEIKITWEPGRYYTYSLTINERMLAYTTGIGHWSER